MSDESIESASRIVDAFNRGDVEADVSTAAILTFAEGKVIRFEDFGDRERALETAGVSERDARAGS
jgi:hypothetical protein